MEECACTFMGSGEFKYPFISTGIYHLRRYFRISAEICKIMVRSFPDEEMVMTMGAEIYGGNLVH